METDDFLMFLMQDGEDDDYEDEEEDVEDEDEDQKEGDGTKGKATFCGIGNAVEALNHLNSFGAVCPSVEVVS
jgi:hypothetical protein